MFTIRTKLANNDQLLLVERPDYTYVDLDISRTMLSCRNDLENPNRQNFDLPRVGKYEILGLFSRGHGINFELKPEWGITNELYTLTKEPNLVDYGYVDRNSFDSEEGGWTMEGGEQAYYEAQERFKVKDWIVLLVEKTKKSLSEARNVSDVHQVAIDRLQQLVELQKEYINHLSEAYSRSFGFLATSRGYTESQETIDKGIELRTKIEELSKPNN